MFLRNFFVYYQGNAAKLALNWLLMEMFQGINLMMNPPHQKNDSYNVCESFR